jgi:LuxR family maltose regulon positive regulatory protein
LLYLVAALRTVHPQIGESTLAALQTSPLPPVTALLTPLLNELSQLAAPFTLVFDDYHVITAQPIHDALAFLVEHLPPTLRLLVTTRIDPPLPLARWRVRNQLAEVRTDHLRFSAAEATTFLNDLMGLELSVTEIETLSVRTEGWIAALQLAALSMQGRPDRAGFIVAFTGSHRFILDYLTEEVLQRQSDNVREFLLCTSIVEQICEALADALTQSTTGRAALDYLEQSNLFLIPLDDERRWYRYHHLFAEVLRAQLQQLQPHRLPELHCRARAWLEQSGRLHEAVNHALAGQEFAQAARLIAQIYGAKWQTGELATLRGWLAAMPAEAWQAHPRLWMVQAWAVMTVGEFDDVTAMLDKAEEALLALEADAAQRLRPELLAMRASHASLVQQPNAVALAQQALQELPTDYWMRGMLVVFLAAAYYVMGDLDAALDVLATAPNAAPASLAEQPHQVHLLAFGGMVHLAKGQLRAAWSLVQQSLTVTEPDGIPIPFVGTLMAYMAASLVLYEQGELATLAHYLTRCEALAADFGSAEVQIFALSSLARLQLANDDLDGAAKYYKQVDVLLQTHTFSQSIMAYVDYHRFQLLLKQGDLPAAASWVEDHSDQPGPLNTYAFHRLALPQILLAWGDTTPALEQITSLIQDAEATGHGTLLIKALILQTLALQASRNEPHALAVLERALKLAAPEGYIRPFVDAGDPLRALIDELRLAIDDAGVTNYIDKLLAAFNAASASSVNGPIPFSPIGLGEADEIVNRKSFDIAQDRSTIVNLIEPLSARELEILGLVADGLSNSQIAGKIIVTVGTVKKHLNNIYGKLGVASRTQAIARGRKLGLLTD